MDTSRNFFNHFKKSENSEKELKEAVLSMIDEGRKNRLIKSPEALMIKNIFDLENKTVKDVMIHRSDILSIDGNTALKLALPFFIDGSFSRYPVFIESIDNIIGIVHIKDVLKFIDSSSDINKKIRDINKFIHPVETVPETHGLYKLFTTMKQERRHMAIVVDEYGQTSGIVTMEDILEEIVGNIQDEHDNEEDMIVKIKPGIYKMNGKTPLSDVFSILNIVDTDMDDIETLNGYIIDLIGYIPKEHSSFTITKYGYDFNIKDVEKRVIKDVIVEKHKY